MCCSRNRSAARGQVIPIIPVRCQQVVALCCGVVVRELLMLLLALPSTVCSFNIAMHTSMLMYCSTTAACVLTVW